jgi:hypothetical protein
MPPQNLLVGDGLSPDHIWLPSQVVATGESSPSIITSSRVADRAQATSGCRCDPWPQDQSSAPLSRAAGGVVDSTEPSREQCRHAFRA